MPRAYNTRRPIGVEDLWNHAVLPGDYQWIMRGLLVAMQQWIAADVAPPPSVYPRVDRKELTAID